VGTPEKRPGEAETVDATRRTYLASERTYLAWWRSGLTALAISFAAGKLVPGLTGGPEWPYEALGIAYAALGILTFAYGLHRQRLLDRALERGQFVTLGAAATLALTVTGSVLGVFTILVVLFAD
jgi:putative membrane protein